ncbi:hypothetical protein QBC36DRAFT_334604 [Triangularia setosa]|uniref:Uncharacterized protein n=1 Tax=Triangularia setosa TaxID=2587417 RepID=A0AAN7A5G4_9PEZI|nr:hypothetical protein QBC36DRAFT_334604 [Podospora setosa]
MATTISARPAFPQEIWWLVAQELARDFDFGTLYTCARVSQGLASVAMPLLYSIHDQSPVIDAHVVGLETSVCLWRSIIASSLGHTRYPYCCWIKSLKLGNLHSILDDLSRNNSALKAQFFQGPMQGFMIMLRGQQLNLDSIVLEVANSITSYIRTAADQAGKPVALTTLEGHYFPTASLVNWISALSCLISLVIRDGSVLTADVARALQANCPSFKHIQCYFCKGTGVDEQLAGFLQNLKPQSLESFTIRSQNNIGKETFSALGRHSTSLQELRLFSLEPAALASIYKLQDCLAIKKLAIEGNHMAQTFEWLKESLSDFEKVVDWLAKCASLSELSLIRVPDATELLSMLSHAPSFKLTSLTLKLNELDELNEPGLYAFIGEQQALRHLTVRLISDEPLDIDGFLATPLMNLSKLEKLDTNVPFSTWELGCCVPYLKNLEEMVLNGDMIHDEYLVHLLHLPKLKSLTILGPSCITGEGLLRFMDMLRGHNDAREAHDGLRISILSQNWDDRLGEATERKVSDYIRRHYGGTFDITCLRDPDEMHESDFSD